MAQVHNTYLRYMGNTKECLRMSCRFRRNHKRSDTLYCTKMGVKEWNPIMLLFSAIIVTSISMQNGIKMKGLESYTFPKNIASPPPPHPTPSTPAITTAKDEANPKLRLRLIFNRLKCFPLHSSDRDSCIFVFLRQPPFFPCTTFTPLRPTFGKSRD